MDTEYFTYKRRTFDALCKFFSFRMQRSTKRLMNFKCGDDGERYAKKAVGILVRKLKKNSLEDLERALNNPEEPSKCVLLQNMDERQFGANRQTLANVTYCRIWRWPDLKSHYELQSIDTCDNPYKHTETQTELCINPYHYKRLPIGGTVGLPSVVIPKSTEFMSESMAATIEQIQQQQRLVNGSPPPNVIISEECNEKNNLLIYADETCTAINLQVCKNNDTKKPLLRHNMTNYFSKQRKSNNSSLNDMVSKTPSICSFSSSNITPYSTVSTEISSDSFSSSSSNSSSDINSSDSNQSISSSSRSNKSSSSSSSSSSSDISTNESLSVDTIYSSGIKYSDSIANSTLETGSVLEIENAIETRNVKPRCCAVSKVDKQPISDFETPVDDSVDTRYVTVPYEEPEYWGSVIYYEQNTRVGEPFLCKYRTLDVDGYTNPNESGKKDRMCLGTFMNIARVPASENTRQYIGKGIRFHKFDTGIILEVLSSCPVFVQSKICNYMRGYDLNTVCKIFPGASLKIFDFNVLANLITNNLSLGFEAVYELIKLCTLRISFVKGWGITYHRQDITATPCWIELHVHGALEFIDKVLIEMDHPSKYISSVT